MAAKFKGHPGADCGGRGLGVPPDEDGVCGVAVEVGVEAAAVPLVARQRVLHC